MKIGVKLTTPRCWSNEHFLRMLKESLNVTIHDMNESINRHTEVLITNRLNKYEIANLPNLVSVICPTSGTEGICFKELNNRNISVYINSNNISKCVSNYTEHYVLSFLRRKGCKSLDGLDVVILGFGNIGSQVYKKLCVHGGNYTIVRKNLHVDTMPPYCNIVDLHEARIALCNADIIINALPLNKETQNALASNITYRSSAIIIGLSRAGILDEIDIAQKVLNGSLSSAVFDVYPPELDPFYNKHPELILTKHTACIYGKGISHLYNFVSEKMNIIMKKYSQ